MPERIIEGDLELELGDEWDVVFKWDDCRAYRNGIHKLGDCKAVDVLAFSTVRRELLMIELKDFRHHRIENKARIQRGALFSEVGHKVRDTVAGITGAARNGDDAKLVRLATELATRTRLTIVLWLEEDLEVSENPRAPRQRHKNRRSVRVQQLEQAVRWLTPHAMICSRRGSKLGDMGIHVRAQRRDSTE
jgi:hypothetical protein